MGAKQEEISRQYRNYGGRGRFVWFSYQSSAKEHYRHQTCAADDENPSTGPSPESIALAAAVPICWKAYLSETQYALHRESQTRDLEKIARQNLSHFFTIRLAPPALYGLNLPFNFWLVFSSGTISYTILSSYPQLLQTMHWTVM